MDTGIFLILSGLLASLVLFSRFPRLPEGGGHVAPMRISVIIPARNEEKNLPLLLRDLQRQTFPVHEILCADDDSSDRTGEIAACHGAKVLSLKEKPSGWIGKSWACQKAADAAEGEFLLFLDADVRLGKDSVERIARAFKAEGCTISVQPYHEVRRPYEQLSLFFNLVQVAANGLGLRRSGTGISLYGPVILFPRPDYDRIGGHAAVRERIVEDMALGERMREEGIPFRLCLGDRGISFRMYGGGVRDLYEGWMKNQASGAQKTPLLLLLLVILWVSSCSSVTVRLLVSAARLDTGRLALYLPLYLIWMVELFRISKPVGSFRSAVLFLFPVPLLFFVSVFLLSVVKKVFRLKVSWKGREIRGVK